MRIYLDSSAIVKRVAIEEHADALASALDLAVDEHATLVASALARVEVARALRIKLDSDAPREVVVASNEAFDGIALAPVAAMVIEQARIIGPPLLRSLDAIHLATAVTLGVDEVWTYDQRMAQVAEELGILSRSPV